MSVTHLLRALFPVAFGAVGAVLAASCGGSFEAGGGGQGVHPGDACGQDGLEAKAADGCNTCTCSGGTWSCTELACPAADGGTPTSCTPGASKSAGDGCNTCRCTSAHTWDCTRSACTCHDGETMNDGCNSCSCSGGQWACTARACPPPPLCTDGQTQPAPDGCNTCTCAGGQWGCTKMACPPVQCHDGETMNDGCNTCTCAGGQWACTDRYCPPPQCKDGETTNDGCNTCTCSAGQWLCTTRACVDAGPSPACGGFLGLTCDITEYCAYTEGQECGAGDGSSVCKPRPHICQTDYVPVCGCDGATYSNVCNAAGAGTGVLHGGPC